MLKKYAIHPGDVTSKNDGETHYIDAPSLAKLYGLKPDEWVEWTYQSSAGLRESSFIHLHPRFDGDYSLPKN